MSENLYRDRDICRLDEIGGFYSRHESAMTSESLNRKSNIAEELAYRDSIIEALKADRDCLQRIVEQTMRLKLGMSEIIKELGDEVNALAVENAALNSAHPQPFGREMMKALDAYEKHKDEVPEAGMLDEFFILRDSIRVETPATDADELREAK